ncbi:MAG TPA: STM3941 family protein [Candidatus Angelobacter sp.]|nr:STM3941 family protein [Candidatus Angelobacter sp.]
MASPQFASYTQLMTPDATVIYPSRTKLFLLGSGGALFVVLGFFLLQSTELEVRLAGIAGMVFFGLCALYAAWRLIRRTPALILNSSGIFENASALSAGFLRWDEIAGMHITTIKNQRSLSIEMKDVDSFLNRQSGIKGKILKMNVRLVGTAVSIPASVLPISLEELIQKIQQRCPGIKIAS